MDDLTQRMDEIVKQGRAASPAFDDHSAYVIGMSASPADVRAALAELGDDAHHVVSSLADDPDEAAKVLKHTGRRLGAELGKFAARMPTKAAAPPVTAQVPAPKAPEHPSLYDSKLSTRDWAKEFDRQQAEKRQKRIDEAKADHERFGSRRPR